MYVVGVGRDAGLQRRNGKGVRLCRRKPQGTVEKIMAHPFRKIARYKRCHPICTDIADASKRRAYDHDAAPENNESDLLFLYDAFEDIAEDIWQNQLDQRTDDLNGEPYCHPSVKRFQIFQHQVHSLVSSLLSAYFFARAAIRSSTDRNKAISPSLRSAVRYAFHSPTISFTCGRTFCIFSVG